MEKSAEGADIKKLWPGLRWNMRLDQDLIRLLLLELEGEEQVDLSNYSEEQIGHHRYHLLTEGLARGADMTGVGARYSIAILSELTPKGHARLAVVREQAKGQEDVRLAEPEYLAALRRNLSTLFNESEFRDLCFDLQVPYEDLPGNTQGDKKREIILYMQRHGRFEALIAYCKKTRPGVSW